MTTAVIVDILVAGNTEEVVELMEWFGSVSTSCV